MKRKKENGVECTWWIQLGCVEPFELDSPWLVAC